MKFRPIDRVQSLSRLEFAAYIKDAKAPLVLTGAMDNWRAMREWSLDFFKDTFPDFPVVAHAPQFPALATCSVKTRLAHYIDYLKDPGKGLIKGHWLKGDPETLLQSGLTPYAGNFNPAHWKSGNRELLFQYVPALPDFIECWRCFFDPAFRVDCETLQSHHFVYLSARGGITPLHDDFWDTHAFLAQIAGCKEAFLFSPDHMSRLYESPPGICGR